MSFPANYGYEGTKDVLGMAVSELFGGLIVRLEAGPFSWSLLVLMKAHGDDDVSIILHLFKAGLLVDAKSTTGTAPTPCAAPALAMNGQERLNPSESQPRAIPTQIVGFHVPGGNTAEVRILPRTRVTTSAVPPVVWVLMSVSGPCVYFTMTSKFISIEKIPRFIFFSSQ